MRSLKEFAVFLSRETKWHGDHNENSKQIICKAGLLKMIYENGSLRHISSIGNEIVRMIYSAVRDKEWITINPVITDEDIVINSDSFKITYKASYIAGEIDFQAHCSISGNKDSSLTFSFDGEAKSEFEKNRIGFCVLHPVEDNKGKKCTIIHSNDKAEELVFPDVISPRQPFADIKSMRWERSGIRNAIDFYGDIFETEDQRNWTDASYKTYCTPLSNPRPAHVFKGQKISQKIVFKADAIKHAQSIDSDIISIAIDRNRFFPFPKIGIGQSTRITPITKDESEIIKKLEFDYYRADIFLFNDDWKTKSEQAFREADLLGFKTELALFIDDNYTDQITRFTNWLNSAKSNPGVIILYHKTALSTPDLLVDIVAPLLKNAVPGVKICCGTNANFVQLNRNRPQSENADYVCFSIHPQEHASDNLTLTENLQAQAYTVESARQFPGNKKIWVSPVNIQRRFNANISNYELPSGNTGFPVQADSRLMSLFGASWITGSLKYLIESGASGITLLETCGERGIIQGNYDSRWKDEFQSVKGVIFPVCTVLNYILSNKKSMVMVSRSTHPLMVDSFVFSDGSGLRIMLLNFTPVLQKVNIESGQNVFSLKSLNAETYPEAVSNEEWLEKAEAKKVFDSEQLLLEPFSVTFVES